MASEKSRQRLKNFFACPPVMFLESHRPRAGKE